MSTSHLHPWADIFDKWYYVCDVAHQMDFIVHEIQPEDLPVEIAGMFLLWKDGTSQPAPTTVEAWVLQHNLIDPDEEFPEPVCVGRVVNGKCVPIGTHDDEDFDDD